MKKAVVIFLTLYYSFAIVVFPMCDFSMVQDLPKMYQHCKETEDPGLTLIDFFTEHLIDFDNIFDEHENNSSEKQHQSQIHHTTNYCVQVITPQQAFITKQFNYKNIIVKEYCNYQNNYSFIFNGEILHPPIV